MSTTHDVALSGDARAEYIARRFPTVARRKSIVIRSHGSATASMDGKRCYVAIGQGPTVVYNGLRDGAYPDGDASDLAGRTVRFGAYGDPASVPFHVTRDVARYASTWTGYTHAWRTCAPSFRHYLMASVETTADASNAWCAGWRTFRHAPDAQATASEVYCPSDVTPCASCGLCDGVQTRPKRTRTRRAVVRADSPGIVLWRGASRFDGAPVTCVAVGLDGRATRSQSKTGRMVQVYYLRRRVAPSVTVRTGTDASVCGSCPLRPSLVPG